MQHTQIFLFLLLPAFVILHACDDPKPTANTTVDVTLVASLSIDDPTSAVDKTIAVQTEYDATTNADVVKYVENIEGYQVRSIQFEIDGFQSSLSDDVYFNGTIGFGRVDEGTPGITCGVDNLPITNFAGTGPFTLTPCNSTTTTIANALEQDDAVKIYLTGTLSKTPVSCDLRVIMDVQMTATAL
jgi:hypothetical protein